ncbi:phage morphogenesis protein [Gracilinema caldarium]|uniref:phage morphogenesis protein n=1 Tax=Gracilinema caldarium TaxID=215591 RepID=UPI0026E9D917|nr:phage morphogenesis protein [Gracilinema caldarium]
MIVDELEGRLKNPAILDRIGGIAVSLVQKNIEQGSWAPNAGLTAAVKQGNKPLRDRGQLLSSITYRAEGSKVVVGTNHPAAELLHNGGTVRPVKSKALAIPAGPWVRTMMRGTDLSPRILLDQLRGSGWSIWRQGNVILGRKQRSKEPLPLFILRTTVTVPARPFMRLPPESVRQLSDVLNRELLEG